MVTRLSEKSPYVWSRIGTSERRDPGGLKQTQTGLRDKVKVGAAYLSSHLLDGRPLSGEMDAFRPSAAHGTAAGRKKDWTTLSFINLSSRNPQSLSSGPLGFM